ncbi:hypothetical protein [Xanthomonas arboricola]|uniref:hypothetical protein n=1 Tax=Xanthomonas arboricola TaxID=56448 RepID=UPI000CEDD66B|nr:hypothetical protein [Xanthomonas arboricola]PPT54895.1 hypothetical protein XarbCFBP8153_20325 [Xanthomonas arboricola]
MKQKVDPFNQARVLATLIKLAGGIGDVDLDHADELWEMGIREDDLLMLGQAGKISFDSVGEDGFKPITLCSVTAQTHIALLEALSKVVDEQRALQARLESLLQHNPEKLQRDISESEQNIKQLQEKIAGNKLLLPLSEPLDAISAHFSSINRVANNYDDVYKNILKPMQDEGRRGIRATVRWAVIGIAASLLVSNYAAIKVLAPVVLGVG